MSSGKKRMVFNTAERILSADQLRQQRLIHQTEAELWRYTLSARGDADLEGGSIPALASALGDRVEVFVVNTVCAGACRDASRQNDSLIDMDSGTDSLIKSASRTAVGRSVV